MTDVYFIPGVPLLGAAFAAAGGFGMAVSAQLSRSVAPVLASAALAFAGFLIIELARRDRY